MIEFKFRDITYVVTPEVFNLFLDGPVSIESDLVYWLFAKSHIVVDHNDIIIKNRKGHCDGRQTYDSLWEPACRI